MNHKLVNIIAAFFIISLLTLGGLSINSVKADGPEPNNNCIPVADADGPYYGYVDDPITLDGSGSYDSDGYITGWKWDKGYGYWPDYWYATATTTMTKSTAGAYTVRLKVKDNEGAESLPDITTAFINGDCTLNPVIKDEPFRIWRTGNWIDFDLSVQNQAGDDCYWYDVELEIWNFWKTHMITDDFDPVHFETTSDPLESPNDIDYTDLDDLWRTNEAGSYYIKAICTGGEDVEIDWHLFTVLP